MNRPVRQKIGINRMRPVLVDAEGQLWSVTSPFFFVRPRQPDGNIVDYAVSQLGFIHIWSVDGSSIVVALRPDLVHPKTMAAAFYAIADLRPVRVFVSVSNTAKQRWELFNSVDRALNRIDRLVSGVIVPEGDGRWTEYAGGYSDMLAQCGEELSRPGRKPEVERPARDAAPTKPQPAKRRMKFKDKHALETLPARIAKLEADIVKLSKTIADPNLYAKDRAAFDKASAALGKAQAELAQAEDDWLRLEELREQVESR